MVVAFKRPPLDKRSITFAKQPCRRLNSSPKPPCVAELGGVVMHKSNLLGGARIMKSLKAAANGGRAVNGVQAIGRGVGGMFGTLVAEQVLGDGTGEQNMAIQAGGFAGGAAASLGIPTLISSHAAVGTWGGSVVTSGLAGLGGSMLGGVTVCTVICGATAFGGAALAVQAKHHFWDNATDEKSKLPDQAACNFFNDFELLAEHRADDTSRSPATIAYFKWSNANNAGLVSIYITVAIGTIRFNHNNF